MTEDKEMLWTIIGTARNHSNRKYLLCKCACGEEKLIRKNSYGRDSFGCKKCRSWKKTHGGSRSSLYRRWDSMKTRCLELHSEKSIGYGRRGITMCKEWVESFEAFQEWSLANGFRQDLSLDRIDNDKGYSPDNCRWTTAFVQARNKRNTVFYEWEGKKMIIKDWCAYFGINEGTVRGRLKSGKTFEQALGLAGR